MNFYTKKKYGNLGELPLPVNQIANIFNMNLTYVVFDERPTQPDQNPKTQIVQCWIMTMDDDVR